MTTASNPRPSVRPARRRGAALVLVLVALAIGLMMVATFLDGRRESVPVTERISDAARARRTADSGLELVLSSILVSEEWIDEVGAGILDIPFEIADGGIHSSTSLSKT